MIVLATVMLVLFFLPVAVSAMDTEVRIYVDGKLTDKPYDAKVIEDAPYIPERFLKEKLGALTVWDHESRTLSVERGSYRAQFVLNERYALQGGGAVRLDMPTVVLSNEIYLPAKAVGDLLRLKVVWDVVNQSLQFYIPLDDSYSPPTGTTQPPTNENNPPVTDENIQPPVSSEDDDVTSAGHKDREGDALIGAISVVGDQIIVQADRPLHKSTVFSLPDPDRLVIDIPNSNIGSILNGQPSQLNGSVPSTHPYIRNIRYALFNNDPSTVRIVIDLSQPVQYSIIQDQDSSKLVLDIRSEKFKVVLDAGHGGKDPGAITYSKWYEKDFTLSLTLKVYHLLLDEPFIKPILTRSDDTFVELDRRADIANEKEADVFLSIHGNTYIPSVHGTETYYYHSTSKYFADIVHKHVVEATGFRDRNVRQQDFKVLRLADMPAALIEVGYVSNKDQEALLYDDAFQDKIAKAIVKAIKQYFQIED